MDDLKLLEERVEQLKKDKNNLVAIRDRIAVKDGKDTKRLLSVGITNLETSILFFKEAIAEQKSVL